MEAGVNAHRRPPALLPPWIARLGGFAALALLGALQWQRMIEGPAWSRAFLWVLVAVAAAAAVLGVERLRRLRRLATLAIVPLALLAAYACSGLPLALLKPRRIDELGVGVSQGAEALASVQLPYAGADPWPSDTLQLLGALLCVGAALLAFWPRAEGRGFPFLSLSLLLILVASPVVSIGGARPVLLGIVLTALTVCFLWLERLPLRPGLGIAAMLALALAGALPLASAADGEDPWFDYKSFAEGFSPDEPLNFDWGHNYGPLDWPREGAEVLRVAADRPSYWKMRNLDDFDGARWGESAGRFGGSDAELDLPSDWRDRPDWQETLRVTLRRMQTRDVLGTGTTLRVEDAPEVVGASSQPGIWRSRSELEGGDSYTVRAYAPRPRPDQLAGAAAGEDPRRADDLSLTVPLVGEVTGLTGTRTVPVEVRFPPFAVGRAGVKPRTAFSAVVRSGNGGVALRRSTFARSWQLAKQLRRGAETPYEYVLAVNRHLQDGFTYDEEPGEIAPGRAKLDGFLFDTRSGYCQHFSGAMALLLRMGGVPARVVTGFSPGGFSRSKRAWVVRDTDAHSWVEAWFDEWGWVTFDPTPAGTPARSQIAALERETEAGTDSGDAGSGSGATAPRDGLPRQGLPGGDSAAGAAGAGGDGGGASRWWFAPAVPLVLALAGWCVLRWRRRGRGPAEALERAIAELEAALRRAGRPAAAGTTLQQLEERLGRTPQAAAYLRALRAGRYAPSGPPPTTGGRRALRRELATGGGPAARLRALWALPPWRV